MSNRRQPADPRLARIILRKEMVDDGLNDRGIARLVNGGSLHRVRFGAYVDGPAWQACDDVGRHGLQSRAVLRQARTDVVLSHLSALGEWDVPHWDLDLRQVHLTRVDQRAGRREAGVQQHVGELREEDTVDRNGIRVTSPTRTALDCMTLLDVEHALVVVNDLLHRGLTTPEALAVGRDFMERWPRTLNQGLVLRRADARIESVGETRFAHLSWRQGLPASVPQHIVRDRSGREVARVDFAWPEHRVFLEFDGKVKYQRLLREGESVTDAVLREKRREELICEITGWRCIRIIWADLYQPERTAQRIRRLLYRSAAA